MSEAGDDKGKKASPSSSGLTFSGVPKKKFVPNRRAAKPVSDSKGLAVKSADNQTGDVKIEESIALPSAIPVFLSNTPARRGAGRGGRGARGGVRGGRGGARGGMRDRARVEAAAAPKEGDLGGEPDYDLYIPDTSQFDMTEEDDDLYAPVSVPFEDDRLAMDVAVENAAQAQPGEIVSPMAQKSAAQVLKELQTHPNSVPNLLLQLPKELPFAPQKEDISLSSSVGSSAAQGAYNSVDLMPDGQIGELVLWKSGRVTMEINGVPYEIHNSWNSNFHQRVAEVDPEAGDIRLMGPIGPRLTLSLDVENILHSLTELRTEEQMDTNP